MKISYSFGMVDLLHFGHISAIKKAGEESDLNIYGIVSDKASDAWFGAHVSDEKERSAVMESIKYVDEVWPQETLDPIDNLRKLHAKYPNAIITLYVSNELGIMSSRRYVESIGGKVVKIDYYNKLSPQAILATLNKEDVSQNLLENNLISTKANTLDALKDIVKKSEVEDLFITTIVDFRNDRESIAKRIGEYFKADKVVVRSSSKHEDAFEESNAGHFESLLDIDSSNADAVINAIENVILSYGPDAEDSEQVLIQRQTGGVEMSGVVFTRDIQRNRPYYVINYDKTGSTDSVTSGAVGLSAFVSYSMSHDEIPEEWKRLMDAVWELEEILSGILLDIEFALTRDRVVIFQVRPLAAAYKFGRNNDKLLTDNSREELIQQYHKMKLKGLSCYSDMAFWNPAEIIGDNPKNLDYSLYREIITKRAWDEGLVPMGYRDVKGELMFRFGNKPYINIERSFQALMPSGISESLAEKLGEYYVSKLKNDKSSHDKIEFEISHNCYDFGLHARIETLKEEGFQLSEIKELEEELKQLTERNIRDYKDILETDLCDLNELESIRLDIKNITKNNNDYIMVAKSIHTLMDAIERFGTPQFSRQARCAFIAKSMIRSLVTEGYVTDNIVDEFMSGVETVATDYERDYINVLDGKLEAQDFKRKYGHLRAGTYDIRVPRYDEMDNIFDAHKSLSYDKTTIDHKKADDTILRALVEALEFSSMEGVVAEDIMYFVKNSISQREYFKFVFTKSLSMVIELIKKIGYEVGIETNDLSYLELPEIYATKFYSDKGRLKNFWELLIQKRRDIYRVNSELILPEVITSEKDFGFIERIASRPNYITESKVEAEVVRLDETETNDIDGKIIVLEKADPGYDWIFSKNIAGLVTKYGGVASHMSIRCAEFRVPAAIGCGASIFEYVVKSKRLRLDCEHERMERI